MYRDMVDLAETNTTCGYCGAQPGYACTTTSGARATRPHESRLYAVQTAYTAGYDEAIREAIKDPAGFLRYTSLPIVRRSVGADQ